ncbi:MAG: prepilin-type N-terminal cleavage/methylation domain-containing protein [Patescibacteria group bacterium]|nr:prepilin-type N-terminal cleavage/methylation domain-containing protein [Patescibacteria group bacterium]
MKNALQRQSGKPAMAAGMTLTELLVALAIFASVMVAVGLFEASVFSGQRTISGSYQSAQDAQIILKTMLSELRSAAQGANGAFALASCGTSSVTFFSAPVGSGPAQEISYSLINGVLYRSAVAPSGNPVGYDLSKQSTSSLVYNVANGAATPLFSYYDENYTGTSSPLSYPVDPTAVTLVKVDLVLRSGAGAASTTRDYSVQASLRNLKTNL